VTYNLIGRIADQDWKKRGTQKEEIEKRKKENRETDRPIKTDRQRLLKRHEDTETKMKDRHTRTDIQRQAERTTKRRIEKQTDT
jgi:hypothetical protein